MSSRADPSTKDEESFKEWAIPCNFRGVPTPYARGLVGGGLLGLSSLTFLSLNGRIAGISGIFGPLIRNPRKVLTSAPAQIGFASGMCLTAYGIAHHKPSKKFIFGTSKRPSAAYNPMVMISAGFLVAVGTTVGSGCTSGHGICGLGRLSLRSLSAVCMFMGTGMATSIATDKYFPHWYALRDTELNPKLDQSKLDAFENKLQSITQPLSEYLLPLTMAGLWVAALTRGRPKHVALTGESVASVISGTVSGALFASGLAISGMTNPDKVRNFLNPLKAFECRNQTKEEIVVHLDIAEDGNSQLESCEIAAKTEMKKADSIRSASCFQLGVVCVNSEWCRPGWDPSLMFTMAGAVAVTALTFPLIVRRSARMKPFLASKWYLPTKTKVDRRLLAGSAVFGVGWGLGGICPGPELVVLNDSEHSAYVWLYAAGLVSGFHVATLAL